MTEFSLKVETELPFRWQPGELQPSQQHANRLLLRVLNLLDVHEPEQERASERIEAKIDLMLHWLGTQLFGSLENHVLTRLRLGQDSIEWDEPGKVAPGGEIVLELGLPNLGSPLRLAARIAETDGYRVRAELVFPQAELEDAWGQWLFRLHRRAIQDARQRADRN